MALVERFHVSLKMEEPFLPKKTDMEPPINRTCLPAAALLAQDTGFVFRVYIHLRLSDLLSDILRGPRNRRDGASEGGERS